MKKNMSRFFNIFVFGIFLNVSYTSGVGSASVSKSIIDEIKHDNNLCTTPSFLYNSNYANECTKIKYSSKPLNLSAANINTFLCLGLYDISYRICYYDSRKIDLNLPTNATQLDSQLKLHWSNDSIKFCEDLQYVKYSPMYNKTQLEVTKLSIELTKPQRCVSICFDFNGNFNPLCSIWVWAAQLPISKKPSVDRQVSPLLTQNNSVNNNQKSQEINMGKGKTYNPISESKVIESDMSKPKELSDIEHVSHEHELASPPKENSKSQTSNNPLPDNTQSQNNSVKDIKTAPKSLDVIETHEQLNTKPESSLDNSNKKSEELEKSISSPMDVENNDPTKQSENTGDSGNQGVTLSPNTDDQKDFNSDEFRKDGYDTEESPDPISEPNNSDHNLPKPSERKDTLAHYPSIRTEDDSHFFAYFMVITLLCVGGYVGYHNKQKILAIVLEGRRSRGGRGRRRPNTASYRKLDCTLEEAVTSQCNSNVTHVIY